MKVEEKKSEEVEKITLLSEKIGYIKVSKKDFENPDIKLIDFEKTGSPLVGRLNKDGLSDHIVIMIKTFYGDRNTYTIKININCKLYELIPLLCEEENKIQNIRKKFEITNQYRLISTLGRINELNPFHTFIQANIKYFELLIIMFPDKIYFSETWKSQYIYLQNKNLTAIKEGGEDFQLALVDKGCSIGRHYFEITIETESYDSSIVIGVCHKRSDYYYNFADSKNFWGYILSDCKKIYNSGTKVEKIEYGDISKINDKIGVLLEFTEQGLDVSFFINKINLGVAFKSLPKNTYYPCVVLGFDTTRVRLSTKSNFPESSLSLIYPQSKIRDTIVNPQLKANENNVINNEISINNTNVLNNAENININESQNLVNSNLQQNVEVSNSVDNVSVPVSNIDNTQQIVNVSVSNPDNNQANISVPVVLNVSDQENNQVNQVQSIVSSVSEDNSNNQISQNISNNSESQNQNPNSDNIQQNENIS